ncbi:MAG: DNA adenine methylase [Candidatus Micrarchaeota archaeon]|nr:DNA adenine methylase [Candidatus Micrarchaeota archaeon]
MMNGIPTFVKWAGGKKQLLPQFMPFFPKKIERYFEPFVGGGAVAFYILKHYKPNYVYLSDSNNELINAYKVIRNNVKDLIRGLKEYKKKHSKEFYYKVRALKPNELSELECAVRFIYLNKTCFNGLYRVNSKGEFNVPIGSYKNPSIVNENELKEISGLLQNAKFSTSDFENIENEIHRGDFVYFDPPYYPLSKTSSFTSYTKEDFLEKDQIRLADLFKRLDKKGAYLMLSNSSAEFIAKLYKEYEKHIAHVQASRMINCDAKGRGKINEVVITNYHTGLQGKL